MHDAGQEILIKDALVFLFAAGVVVPLLRFGRIPAVAGFVLAGAALGPHGLGALAEQFPVLSFFAVTDPSAAAPFAELGVLFLLFLLGLELSFAKLWALRRVVFGAGSLQTGVSALVIGGAAFLMGLDPFAAATVGLALALSSTAVVMQVLIDERRAATPVGRTALGVLLLQDILVAPILIFVGFVALDDGGGDSGLLGVIFEALVQGVVALAIIVLIGRYVLRHVFRIAAQGGGRDFLMALTLLTVVGAAVITASAGLSLALGAFLAGLLLGETEFKHQTEVDLEPFKGLLLGLFFLTVGMGLDLGGIVSDWALILGGVVALVALKFAIAFIACRLFAGPAGLSVEAASLLAPAGEFAFVILAAALAGGVVEADVAARLTAMAGLSMLAIPLLGRLGSAAARRFLAAGDQDAPLVSDYSDLEGHVLVAGFGRVGHAVARIMHAEDAELVALERDPPHVARARREGWKVYVGDAARPEILTRAGAEGAALFVVTVDDAASAEAMVRAFRSVRPEAPILARARDAEHALKLEAAGANFVIPDAVEAGLQMAGRALESFGYDTETVRDRIALERDAEYRRAAGDDEP